MHKLWAMCLLAMLLACQPCFAGGYAIYDLGVAPTFDGSYGEDINNSGVAICSACSANDTSGVFTWSKQSGMTDLSGLEITARRINDLGQTLGAHFDMVTLTQEWFIRDPDGSTHALLTGGRNSWPVDINASGQVAGFLDDDVAILRQPDGSLVPIPMPEPYQVSMVALSESGSVLMSSYSYTGHLEERAWVWDVENGLVQLSALDGSEDCIAHGINDLGVVVGRSRMRRAVRWNLDGTMTDLGYGCAYGINNLGQIAGQDSDQRPVIWNPDGTVIDLGVSEGAAFAIPAAINDLGQVVGTKYVPVETNGDVWYRPLAVMWDPVPEPSSLLALAGGILCLGARYRRRY